MKKTLTLLSLCLIMVMTLNAQKLIIKGHITDTDTAMVLLRSMDKCDTIFTSNGKFTFSKHINTPELF